MNVNFFKIPGTLFFLGIFFRVCGADLPVVVIESTDRLVSVHNKIGVYEAIDDPNFRPGSEEISGKQFQLNTHKEVHLHFDNESGFWIKFKVKNLNPDNTKYLLEINNPTVNRLSFYKRVGNSYSAIVTGDALPFSSRNKDLNIFAFDLILPYDQEQTFYMYVNTEGDQVNFPIYIWEPSAFGEKVAKDRIISGIFYGILFLIIVLHFFFYFNLKDFTHIYYLSYVASVGLILLSLDGLFFQYITPNLPWLADRMLILAAFTSTFFLIIFAQLYLETKRISPLFHKILNVSKYISIALIICALAPPIVFNKAIMGVTFFDPLVAVLVIVAAFKTLKFNRKLATYFIIAFGILIIGVIIIVLKINGLLAGFPLRDEGLKIGVVGEIIVLSFALTVRFKMMQEETQALALDRLEKLNQMKDEQNVQLEKMVKERTVEIHDQKEIIEKKNTKITDSIKYAKRIQDSLLPSLDQITAAFPQSLIFYKPKDIVSGDFYWFTQLEEEAIIAAVDCTGHGVPGAFMSMLGSSLLNQIVNIHKRTQPAEILHYLNEGVKVALRQNDISSDSKDGMDIALCKINYKTRHVEFAGAKRPLYILNRQRELDIIKGGQFPIGGTQIKKEACFENHSLNLHSGDAIYIFTDGYIDQFGGPDNFKLMTKNFKDLLHKIHGCDMTEQASHLRDNLEEWKGNLPQTDDILVIGIKF